MMNMKARKAVITSGTGFRLEVSSDGYGNTVISAIDHPARSVSFDSHLDIADLVDAIRFVNGAKEG